ncbi:MAG TPA: FecR family protein [Edaphobacter sp.]|nr:FecR family protein [Edaphobacter sp.]
MRTFALQHQWRKHFNVSLFLFLLVSTAWTVSARADDAPAHRAARLSYLQGNVTVDHMDNTAGDPAQVNMPLAEGARLSTGEDGQAEVEFEDGSVVRMTPNSSLGLNSLSVDALGNFHTQLTVLGGLLYAELRATTKFTYTVEAGGEQISPVANATIRINLDQPPVTIAVLDGTVHLEHGSSETGGYKTDVHAGEMLTADASDSSQYFMLSSIEKDSWDVWNQERDQAAAEAAAARTAARDGYAGDQGYGWSDLDANGSWYDVAGEGQVWQPTLALDSSFDPYGYGSWVTYPGAGYVWASGYAWGWIPFRCGSWSYWNGFGWGWSPGAACRRVGWGFHGFGSGVYAINIGRPPANYHLPTRPVHIPGMLHPIPVGRAPRETATAVRPSQEPRMIAGVPVGPLRPIGNPTAQKDRSVVGSALRSDFAVDRLSRQPVLGVGGVAPLTTPRSDLRSAPLRPSVPSATNGTERPVYSLSPTSPQQQRSNYPAQPQVEHSAPRPAAAIYAPRSAPPPSTPQPPRSAPSAPAPAAPRK